MSQVAAATLVGRFEAAGELAGGAGRFGLVTRVGAWQLEARREAFAALAGAGGAAVRALDVSLLGAALDALAAIDAAAVAAGERITYASPRPRPPRLLPSAPTARTPPSCWSPRPWRPSWPSPATATSCPRSRPISIPRP